MPHSFHVFVTKEFVSMDSEIELFVQRQLIDKVIEAHNLQDFKSIKYKFVTFDWNSRPLPENEKYHHIIDECIRKQLKFYELIYEI